MTKPPISIDRNQPIGIIGIGLMGTAIGHRLLDMGYSITVWNRTRPEAEPLMQRGATWSDNPFRECQRVIVCLFNSEIVRAVLSTFRDAFESDHIVIDMTTGAPDDAETMAKLLRAQSAHYLDAPVSGSSEQTRQGQVMIMIGGDRQAYEACSDLWMALGRSIHFTGKNGSASRMKLVTNLVLGLNRASLAEGLTFAARIGVEPESALTVLQDSAAASRVMDVKGQKMINREFSVQARLSQHLKDVRLILDLAEECGLELPLSQTHQQLLVKAENAGCGELDNSAVICAYEEGDND